MQHIMTNLGTNLGRLLGKTLFPLIILAAVPSAQVEHGGGPVSRRLVLRAVAPTQRLAAVDVEALRIEDSVRTSGQPFRFGEKVEVDLNLQNAGTWQELPDGSRVWRLRVQSDGAYSLGLMFSRFQLPVDGEFFVYNDDRTKVRGAYTYLNQKPNGRFAIQPTPGEAVTLEYYEPAGSEGGASLALSSIIHDYVGFESLLLSGPCNVDVSCPVAAPFTNQVDATVHMAIGPFLCSGVLINNTAEDGTQYLLTAQHCGDPEDAIFRFNFQRDTCCAGVGPMDQSVQGAEVVATDSAPNVDLTLVRVIPQIPYNTHFAGWDRSGVTPFATFGIHHPSGDEKAIAIDADSPTSPGNRWKILEWDLGTTEVGSSGSALFDPAGRIIGHLYGGEANCGSPVNDFYTRFDVVWDQVEPFLDPLGTGQMTLDGYDPDDQPVLPLTFTEVDPSPIEILNPGTARTVALQGTGFNGATTLELDGVPIDSAQYGWINQGLITLDMPQVDSIGPYTLTVRDGLDSVDVAIDVVANAHPTLQAGDGDPGFPVVLNLDFIMAGEPGDLHFVTFSESLVPSVHPVWVLEYGNQFSDLTCLGVFTIPAAGYLVFNSPSGMGNAGKTFYASSTLVGRGLPALVSNLQEVRIIF